MRNQGNSKWLKLQLRNMFEALITQVLNKVLGGFIENIDSNQLDISLLAGEVRLTNIKLKSTLFDSLPFPFALDFGQIGLIYLKLPFQNLFNKPILIELSDVFALVRPKHIKEWNEEVEIKAFRESTQSQLEKYELWVQETENLIRKDPGSIEKLVTKLIDNIEINIKNIYVRYEDDQSSPNQGQFVMGLLLQEFTTKTTGSDWISKLVSAIGGGEDMTYKIAKLTNFTIFLDYEMDNKEKSQDDQDILIINPSKETRMRQQNIDYERLQKDSSNLYFQELITQEFKKESEIKHHYLLDNFSMEARLKLNKNPMNNKAPQLDIDILLGGQFHHPAENVSIDLSIYQPQIIRILKLIEYIGYYNEFQQGALFHFWKKPLKQELANEYIKNYCEWTNTKSEAAKKNLQLIEDDYPAEKMIILRKFASKLSEFKAEEKKTDEKIDRRVQDLNDSKPVGFFASKETKDQRKRELEDFRFRLQQEVKLDLREQKRDLDKELELLTEDLSKQQIINPEDFDSLPEGYLRYKIQVAMPSLKFAFINEYDQQIFTSELNGQYATMDFGKSSTKIGFQLNQLNIADKWTGATAFPHIIETKKLASEGEVEEDEEKPLNGLQDKNALTIKFESNETLSNSPFQLSIASEKTLLIVANFHLIKEIKRTLIKAFKGEVLDLGFYKEAATEQALQYMNAGKELLESIQKGEYEHSAMDISVFLTAPIIMIPENIFNPEKPLMVVDTGSIKVKSRLTNFNNDTNYKEVSLASALYDRYEIKLSNFQINILEHGLSSGIQGFERGQGQQIIRRFNALLVFFNCIEPMHSNYPTAELAIIIQNFEMHFGLRFIKYILRIQNAITEQLDSKEEQIFTQVNYEKKDVLIDAIEKEKWRKIRDERKQVDDDESTDDEFYTQMVMDLDPSKLRSKKRLEKEYNYKVPVQDKAIIDKEFEEMKNQGQIMTNFKCYFTVEKFQITIQSEIYNSKRVIKDYEDIMQDHFDKDTYSNILMLHFGVEFEIDRHQNTLLNLNVHKFLIQDVQKESKIAQPFRLILSSPIIESTQSYVKSSQSSQNITIYKGGVMVNSLISLILNESTSEVSQIQIQDEYMNELELGIKMATDKMDINCQLSELRFVFAIPTAQKLLKINAQVGLIFDDLEKERLQERKTRLEMYEFILSRLCNDLESDEMNFTRRVLTNMAKDNSLEPDLGAMLYQESLQRLYHIWDVKQNSDTMAPQDKAQAQYWFLRQQKVNDERNETKVEAQHKLSFKAKLHNFSVWIPLHADSEQTQVFSLGFQSDLHFQRDSTSINTIESTLNQVIRSDTQESTDNMSLTISQFVIQMLQSEDTSELLDIQKQSIMSDANLTSSKLLSPCRITITMDNYTSQAQSLTENKLRVILEPMHIKVGFKHIDFINIVWMQIQGILDYMNTINNGEKQEEVVKLKEEVKVKEQAVLESQCVQMAKSIKFVKYSAENKPPVSISQIKVECDSLKLSLNDDSQFIDQPLIYCQIQNLQAEIQSYEKEDDAATYYLKKLGIWQKNYPEEAKAQQYKQIVFYTQCLINYYNPRSLAFEPLLEPWFIKLSLAQQAPYTCRAIHILSERLLNLNLTFGMALTLRKIRDRFNESMKQAEVFSKLETGKSVTADELEMSIAWRNQMMINNDMEAAEAQALQTYQPGFILQNYTGLDLKCKVHDDFNDEDLNTQYYESDAQIEVSSIVASVSKQELIKSQIATVYEFDGSQSNAIISKTFDELQKIGKAINTRKTRGHNIETMEDDPLKMDFKLDGYKKLSGVPIEGLGVHAYRVALISNNQNQSPSKLGQLIGKKDTTKQIGVIVNVKMDGTQKKVSIESQVIIVNNLKRDVAIFVRRPDQEEWSVKDDQRSIIPSNGVFRVPLSWIHQDSQMAMFIEAKARNHCLFKHLEDLFSHKLEQSKLTVFSTQVVKLQYDQYVAIDIHAYSCLPYSTTPDDVPPQYVISFNTPLLLSNYNFHPIELQAPGQQNSTYAQIAPKEHVQIACLDMKPSIEWIMYEGQNTKLYAITELLDIQLKIQQKISVEKFSNRSISKEDQREVKLIFEYRKQHYQKSAAYQENFELRERLMDFVASTQIMIYPQYMLVNKTSIPTKLKKCPFPPYSNDYFYVDQEKLGFKIPGYKKSEPVSITNIGLSGVLAFEQNSRDKSGNNQNWFDVYRPQKLELGVMVFSAPTPFNKTTLIQVVPRFLLINQLENPLIIKQKGMKAQILLKNQQTAYHFESKKDRAIMIREPSSDELISQSQGKGLYPDLANDENQFWSSPFSIDDVEDFQVMYPHVYSPGKENRWYHAQPTNNYYRFVRIMVTTQNEATILIVFTNPQYPEYELQNKTEEDLDFGQMQEESIVQNLTKIKKLQKLDDMIVNRFFTVKSKQSMPFTWPLRTNKIRMLGVKFGGSIQELEIDKALKKTEIELNQRKYLVEIRATCNARKIRISNIFNDKDDRTQALFLQNLLKRYFGTQLNIYLDMKGLGLSFIDDSPQELLFLSVYDLKVQFQQWIEAREDGSNVLEENSKLKLYLQHLQLDNMINQVMPVVLAPTRPLIKESLEGEILGPKPIMNMEETKEEQKQTQNQITQQQKLEQPPFIQLIISYSESFGVKEKIPTRRLRALQFAVQEFIFQIETSIFNSNLKFVIELIQTLTEDDQSGMVMANADILDRAKQQSRYQVCSELDPYKKDFDELSELQLNKMFIEFIDLGAIKAFITFRLEKKAVEIDIGDPAKGFGAINILYTLLAGVASISNSPLTFKQLILIDTFASPDTLISQISKNYVRQGVMQFYKLLGSSDIIGNPVGLVNKLGTGVYEFISEPTKGLLKGPDEFVGGVGKGVQSLVSNVISGGFESVSKITGSLYTVVKNVSGEKNVQIKKSQHIGDGLYLGVKGGVSELVGGVTGIITKPIKRSKEEGARGFFKGLGSGLVGAIASPVTATLRAGSSISQGVAASANQLGNVGKTTLDTNSLYSRFRPPRYINTRSIVAVYNQDMAVVNQILRAKYTGRYGEQTIKYFVLLPETKQTGEVSNPNSHSSLLIITDSMLIYLRLESTGQQRGRSYHLFKSRLRKVKNVQVYQARAGNIRFDAEFILVVTCYSQLKGMKKYCFQSGEFHKLEKIYNLLSILPQCDAEDKVRNLKSKPYKFLDQCF